jgi:hypothetical protein
MALTSSARSYGIGQFTNLANKYRSVVSFSAHRGGQYTEYILIIFTLYPANPGNGLPSLRARKVCDEKIGPAYFLNHNPLNEKTYDRNYP